MVKTRRRWCWLTYVGEESLAETGGALGGRGCSVVYWMAVLTQLTSRVSDVDACPASCSAIDTKSAVRELPLISRGGLKLGGAISATHKHRGAASSVDRHHA